LIYNRAVDNPTKPYQVIPYPAERRIVADAGRLGIRRHITHGLFEIDVTEARRLIGEHRARTGVARSFTAFVVCSLAQAIGAHPGVCAYRTWGTWGRRLVIFDDVDVVTMIESVTGGVAVSHIIRGANRKTFVEISDEIRAVQADSTRSGQQKWLAGWATRLPRFVRDIFYRVLLNNPHRFKRYAGTAIVTAVGMFGRGGGWGIGFLPMHTLGLTVGGIVTRPAFVGDAVSAREYLPVTISFDHDVVDGAPAARFVDHFRRLMEEAACLEGVI
jgi:pyruvate/2-oxoglutarate dehydrogenase complex dihydrolipoamide acyltransferase (E2) component